MNALREAGQVGLTLRRIASAAPDLTLGASYLITWASPTAFGARSLRYLMFMVMLEFIVIHSAALMGVVAISNATRSVKSLLMIGLAAFYSSFVVAFAHDFGAWWPVSAFWLLTLNRLTGVLFSTAPSGQEQFAMWAGWTTSVVLYLGWIFVTGLVPMPQLGISAAVAAANDLPGSGLLVDEPYRLVAFGAAYYLSTGLAELVDPWSSTTPSISPAA